MTPRGFAYAVARFLGDVNAIRRGRILQRLFNRLLGRLIGRVSGRWWL